MERSLLLLLLIAVCANAGRIIPRNGICTKTCNPNEFAKFKFRPGRDYHYDYLSHTLTGLDGEDNQSSGLRMKAKASFEVVSPCEMVLRMRNVRIEELSPEDGSYSDSPRTADFKYAVERHELHFSFEDGSIPHLCPVKEEHTWVLNIKRGVISMMQNTMPSLTTARHVGTEVDVAGECKAHYTITPKGIRREKDLRACSGRENRESALQSIPYFVRSNTQAAPLTMSKHVCHQTISSYGHFEKIVCEEEHRLHSISRGQKSARTLVTQSLTFIGDNDAPLRSHAHSHRRTTLRFDFEKNLKRSVHDLAEVRDYLRDVCAKSRSDVRPETPRFFTEIVYRLRRLNERDLKTIFTLVDRRKACRSNNDIVRRLVVDAIPILGNAQSMSLMKMMIMSGRVSNIEANLWLTSLAFVQRPTLDMLRFLKPLLDEEKPRSQAVLGVSAMVHQYCTSRRECYTESVIQDIGRSLRKMVNSDCTSKSVEDQGKILLALKAIGNAGVISVVSPDLVRCINKDENPMAIRVAATEAFRRMDCSVNRKPLVEVYRKQELDSELRINSYLALMTCPTEETLDIVKTQLNIEKVNQVGSFVWTHLTNLAETNDPLRKHVKDIVEDVKLKREFKLDKLKFSRNIEKSFFLKSFNAGGRMESNVIWSQKSFLPRSVSLNLTSHLFGQSYNFLEVNGRVEGLETLLERYFGPEGYFKKGAQNKTTALSNKDFQFMDNKFKLQNDKQRAGLGLKVFGHEVFFFDHLSTDAKKKEGFNFLEVLIKLASNQEMEWGKNFMFLDSKITIPTISGLPLELSINGTTSVNVKAKGKLDIRRMVSWPTTFDIAGTVQPSGSVEVSAMMGVNAYYTRHGLKMVTNAHTSTQVDAKLKAKDSETFDVEFGMPRDKQEIINFDSKFYVVHRNTEKEHSLPNVKRVNRKFCTGKTFERTTGAELCAIVRSPAISSFQDLIVTPIVGPLSASVALYKRDTHTSYRLKARWQRKKHRVNNQVYYSRFARFEVDTPNSRVSRRHLANFALDFDSRAIRFHLENPTRRIGFSGAFTNQMGRKELKLSFFKDTTAYFHVQMANRITRNGSTTIMTPTLKVMIPGVPFISLQSRFAHSPQKSEFSIELKNLLRGPLVIGGSTATTHFSGRRQIGRVQNAFMNSHFFVGAVTNSIRQGNGYFFSATKVTYGPSTAKQHTAEFNTNLRQVILRGERRYHMDFDHQISQWSSCRSKVFTRLRLFRRSLSLTTTAYYGEDLNKTFAGELQMKAERNQKHGITMTCSGSVKIPYLNRFHSGKAKVVTEPRGVTFTVNYKHKPKERTFKLIYNAQMTRTEQNIKLTTDIAAHYKDQHALVGDMEMVRHSSMKYTMVTRGAFNDKKAAINGTLEFPEPERVSSMVNVRVGESEAIRVNLSGRYNILKPSIVLKLDRNGANYNLNASYNFARVAPGTFELDFNSQTGCPKGEAKLSGEFKVDGCNFDGNVNVEWGTDKTNMKKMVVETSHQLTTEGSKRKRDFELRWKHPLRQGHVQVSLEREDYKGSMHLELETAPKKQFVIDSMFEIDDGWTQKGLMATLTVKTPFKRFEQTHVGVNLLGQLRYRRAEITFRWGNNKRIVTTLVIRPTGGTNFLATLKVVTPFARYSFMRFHMKNEFTGNQLQSELISEIGTKKTYFKVHGVNNGDSYMNDLAMSVSMTSPFEEFRDVTLTIDHKDDSNQYNSKLEFKWNKNKKISTITNFNYHRNGVEIRTNGMITYTTPFQGMDRGSIEWQHQNTESMMKSEVNVEYLPDRKIGIKLNGLVTEPEDGALRITGKSSITGTKIGNIESEFLHHHTPNSFIIRATCDLPKSRSYEFEINGNRDEKRIDGDINLNTPHDGFRKIGASLDIKNEESSKTFNSLVYAGNTKAPLASIEGKVTLPSASDPAMSITARLENKIVRNIEISFVHQHHLDAGIFTSGTEVTYAPSKTLALTTDVSWNNLKKLKTSITTPFRRFKRFRLSIEFEGEPQQFQYTHYINCNNKFEMSGGLRFSGSDAMLVAESKVTYRGFHYIRFSHKKSGNIYETNAIVTFKTSNTIRMTSEVQVDPRLNVDVKLITPFDAIRNVQAKLSSQDSRVVTGSASYTFAEKIIAMNALLNMKDTEDIRANFEMKTPFENIRDVSVMLQHTMNGKEFVTTAIGKSENGRVEFMNIFQNVGTLKNKFVIKTPFQQFKGITFSFEHRGHFPKLSHRHHLSFNIAGVRARLNNKFDVYKLRLIEVESTFRSNVEVIKKAGFRFTFDKPIGGIETGLLIEWPQDKVEGRIAFKSSLENKIQLKISTPFYYFKELQGLYKLQNQGVKNFKHQIILAFKNEPFTLAFENALTIKTPNYIDAYLKINTPVDSLKSFAIGYHHEMLKRGKSVEAKAEYNDMKYSIKGVYSNVPIHVVEVTLKTPHKEWTSTTLRNELVLKDNTNWKFNSELQNAEVRQRYTINIDLKNEKNLIEFRNSFASRGKPFHHMIFKTSWEDEKMYTASLILINRMLPRSATVGRMISIEGTADLRNAISLRATLRTPFKKVENQWVTLRFERNDFLKSDNMKTGNLIVKGNLMSKTAMLQVRYSYGKRPSFQVLVQLPDMQDMKLEGSLVTSETNAYLKMSLNVPDYLSKPWNLMVDVTKTTTITASFKLDTSIDKYEAIAGRASITKEPLFAKVTGRLSLPMMKKPIEFNLEGDLRYSFKLIANLKGPIVRYFRYNVHFSGDSRKFEVSSEMFSAYFSTPFIFKLKMSRKSGLKIEHSIRTPHDALRRLFVEISLSKKNRRGHIEIDHNKLSKPIRLEGKFKSSEKKFKGRVFLKTPFEKAEHSEVNVDFEKDGYKVTTSIKAKTSAMEGQILGNLNFNYEEPKVTLKAKLETPFEQMKAGGLDLELTIQKDASAQLMLTHNKLPGEITNRFELKAGKSIEFELSTPFDGWYKHALLSVNAQKTGERYKVSTLVKHYPAYDMTATVQTEVSLPKIFVSYNIATPYNVIRQTYGSMNIKAERNFAMESELYHNALSEKITLSIQAEDAETKTLAVQWNGPFKRPLKDISAKLHFTPKSETFKTFSLPLQFTSGARINYHMNKEITFSTSLDITSIKKFNIKMETATPFEVMKTASVRVETDVENNLLLDTEVTHNKLPENISARLSVDIPSRVFFMQLSTPFDGPHKRITVDGSIKKSGIKQVFQVSAEYYPSKKLSVSGTVNPDVKDLEASFKLTTPFEIMKEMTGNLKFNPMAAPMFTFEINHNKLPSKIEARVHVRPLRRLKIVFKTPFEGPWKDILVDYRLRRTGAAETATAVLKYHPDNVLRAQLSFEKQEQGLTAKLTFSTPFEMMKKMETTFSSNWEKDVVSTLQLHHNKLSERLYVVMSYEKKEAHLVQVALETPFEVVKDLDFKVSYLNKDNVRKSSLTVNYNKSKTYELHSYLKSTDNVKEVSLGLKTPFEGIWRAMSFSSQYNREAQKHSMYVKAIYDSVKTIELSTLVNTDINDFQATYSIKTPFEVMKFTEGKMTLNILSTKQYLRSAAADKRFNAQVEFIHNKLMNGKKLTITADGTLGPDDKSVKVEINVLDRTFNGKIFYKKDGNRFSMGSSIVTDNPERPWFVQVDIFANGVKDWEITVSSTCPEHRLDFETQGVLKVNVKHTGDLNAFKNSLDITSPYKKDVQFSCSFDKSDNYRTELVLRAPMKIVKEIEFRHVGDENGFKTIAQATLKNMDPFVFSAKSIGAKSKCELVMNLKLPLESWKHHTMNISQTRGITKSSATVLTTFAFTSTGFGKLNFANDFSMSSSGITNLISMENGLVNIKAPKTLKINFKASPITLEESSAELTVDTSALTESIKVTTGWLKTSTSLRTTFEINAINEFLKTKAVLDIPMMKVDDTLATFSLSSKAMKEPAKLSVNWKKTSASFEGGIDSQIPVKFLKSKVTVLIPMMTRDESDATVSLTSTDMSEPATLNIYWKKAPSTFMATVDSKIPVQFLKSKVQVTIPTMTLAETKAQLSLTSTELKEPATVSVSWKKTEESLKADVISDIPVKFMKATASLNIPKMSLVETDAAFTLTSDGLKDPAKLAVNWKKTSTSFKGNLVSEIAVDYLQSKITVDIAKMQKDEVMATMTVSAQELEEDATLSVGWKKTETSFEGAIDSKIPVKYLKSKVTIKIPKMGAKSTDATLTVVSSDLKEPVRVTVTWEKSSSSFKSSLDSDIPITGLTLKSSLELKSIALDNFDGAFELESAELGGKTAAKLSWKKEPKNFNTNFHLETPKDCVRNVDANFVYNGDLENLDSALTMSANKLGRLAATLKWNAKTMDKQLTVDVQRSSEKLFSLSIIGDQTHCKTTIEMPKCETVKKIEFNKQWDEKKADTSLSWDSNKVSLEVERSKDSLVLTIQTTFKELKNLKIDCNFPFTETEKEISVKVEHPNGSVFAKVTVKKDNGLKVTGIIENSLIPKIPNMSVEMHHQGTSARKFKNLITVKVGDKEGKVDTNFNILDKTEGSLQVTTPFENFEKQSMEFTLDRSKPEFTAAVETGFGSGSVKLESGTSPADAVTLTLKFNKKVYQASVNYSGTAKSFTAGLSIIGAAGRVRRSTAVELFSIKVTSQLEDASYSGSVDLASKFLPENYQNIQAQVNAKGDFKLFTEFSLDASAVVNKLSYSTELKWYLTKSGSISFKFPGKQQACVISGDVSVDLTQGIKVESRASKCDGEIYNVNIKSNLKNQLVASLKSRLEGSNTQVVYQHKTGTKKVEGQVTFTNEKLGAYEGSFTASWEKDVKVNLLAQMPDKSTAELDLTQTGTPEAMTIEVSAKRANEIVIDGKLSYSIKNPISIIFTLDTPFEMLRKTELSFNHKSEEKLFETKLEFNNNKLGHYVSTLSYDSRQGAKVVFTLTTPHKLLKDLKILFSYKGQFTTNFDHAFFVTYEGMKMGYSLNLILPKLLYRIEIDTPFPGYRKIVITNEHDGNMDKFSHKVKINIGPGRVYQVHVDHHMTKDSYNANLKFNSPFKRFDKIHLKLHHRRPSPTQWLMNHQLRYGPGNVISAEGVLNHGIPNINALLTIKTPFKQVEVIELGCEHNHRSNVDFDFNHSLRVNQKSGTFRGSFRQHNDKILGLIVLNTPFDRMKHFDANFRHVGGLHKFTNDVGLTYATGRTMSLKTHFDISRRNAFRTEMHLNTPFDRIRTGKLIINHEGLLNQHAQRLEFGTNGRTFAYNGMVSVVDPMNMATDHTFTLPFTNVKSIKVQFDHKNGVAHLNFLWNTVNYVKIEAIINRQNTLLAKLTVTTSFPSMKKSSISLRHSGSMIDFNADTTFNFNGAVSNIKLRFKRSLPNLYLSVSLPSGTEYEVNIGVKKIGETYQGKVKIAKGKQEILNVVGTANYNFSRPKKMLHLKFRGLFPTVKKNPMTMEVSFRGDKNRFVALTRTNFFTKHHISTTLTYNTYKQISAEVIYNNTPYSIGYTIVKSSTIRKGVKLSVNMAVGVKKADLILDMGPRMIELIIRTPFEKAKHIYLMVYHRQNSKFDFKHRSVFSLNKHRHVDLDLSVNPINGRIAMKAPLEFTIKYSMSRARVIRAVFEVNPDKNDDSKKIVVSTSMFYYKDVMRRRTTQELSFVFRTKYRNLRMETRTVRSPYTFFHKTTINPDHKTSQPWKIYLSTVNRGTENKLRRTDQWILSTPVREMKVFMETEQHNDKLVNYFFFHWDNQRAPSKKMGWKLKVERRGKEHTAIVSFHHPKFRDGVSLRTKSIVNSGNTIIRTKANFRYSDNPKESIDFALKIGRAGQKMVRGSMSIRQEATQLNTRLSGSFGGNRGVYINGLTLAHRMNGRTKVFQVLSHVNVLKHSLMLDIVTPVRSLSWMSVANIQSGGVTITYQLAIDKIRKAFGEVVLAKSPSFKTRLYFNPKNTDNYIETYGRFVNKKHFEFQIHRMMANRRYSDFVFTLRLQGEHLLKSRLFWRPSLLVEAQRYIRSQVEGMKANAKVMWPNFVTSLRNEWNMKKNLIIATIPNFEHLRDYSLKEIALVRDDLNRIAGMIYDSYLANDFYLHDIAKALWKYTNLMKTKAKVMSVAIQTSIINVYLPRITSHLDRRPQWLRLRRILQHTLTKASKMAREMSKGARTAGGIGKRHIYRGVEKVSSMVKSMHQKYSTIEKRVFAGMHSTATAARQHYISVVRPRYEKVRAMVSRGLKTLSNYHRDSKESIMSHFHRDLRNKMTQVHNSIQRGIDTVSHRYGLLFHSLRQKMNRRLNSTLDFSHARYASGIIKSGIKKIQWAYDQFDVEQKLKDFSHAQYLKAIQYVKENSIDVIRDYLRMEQNQMITFEPEKGRIEGQVYIPFEMQDLQSRPDFSSLRRTTNKIRKAFRRPSSLRKPLLPSIQSIKQHVLRYIPNIEKNPRAWMPTFRGYASISGKHIVTFDKVHYDLDGNCDYVLSRDYKGEQWAIVLNQATKKRHVTFVAYNKVFGIHPDYSVTVDGVKVELPFVHGNLSIIRFGPIIKAKDTVLGFSVTSDVVNDIHTVGVTGWYHGKLGGLFGNFDNEPFNDMQTNDHQITEAVDTFIQSWALRNCQHNNNAGPHRRPSKIATKICKFLFGCPLSPLSKCFKYVDPKPFLETCLSDVDEMESTGPKTRICRAARLYAFHCRMAHVRVRIPRPCRRCRIPGRESIMQDSSVTLENTKATADVVFIVEEAPCNKDVVPRLSDIVQRMEGAFKRRGITDNRYGLVGFGRSVHGLHKSRRTHSHTVNSQLMGEATSFTKALSNFELADNMLNSTDIDDSLRGIIKATEYPLRPGSARHFVILPCAACREKSISSNEVEEALKDQDIVLYVLIDQQIRLRRPSMTPQSNYLFGVDRRAVFTQKDVTQLRWDTRLMRQVVRPLDSCSRIAYSTGGAVFNSRKLTKMHVTSQVWFAQVFANRMASSSHSPKQVDCECNVNQSNLLQLTCKKNGSAVVRGVPQPVPLPLALPQRQASDMKLNYRR